MSVQSFIPTIWSAQVLQNLKKRLVGEAFVNHSYEGDILIGGGGSVKINRIGDVTLRSYDGSAITYEDMDTEATTLNINNIKYCAVELDDVDRVQVRDGGALMGAYTDRMAYTIAEFLDGATFTEIAGAVPAGKTYGDDTTPIKITDGASAKAALLKLKSIMDKAGVPKDGRRVAASSDFTGYLLADPYINIAAPTSQDSLVAGYIGKLYGFEIFETENVPNTTGGNGQIIASHALFTTEANQLQNFEALRSEKSFKDLVRALVVSGVKTVMPEGTAKVIWTPGE